MRHILCLACGGGGCFQICYGWARGWCALPSMSRLERVGAPPSMSGLEGEVVLYSMSGLEEVGALCSIPGLEG